MKKEIMFLIIGILIGAIVTTTCFLIYNKTHKSNIKDFDRGNFKQMMENGEMPEGMEPPEGFNGERPERMEKPDELNKDGSSLEGESSNQKQRNSKKNKVTGNEITENKTEEAKVSNEVSL